MFVYIDNVITHNKAMVNVDLITYIDEDSCDIWLSDSMKIKTNDRSISAILRCFEKHMESEDCRNCNKWGECECGEKGHVNGTSQGYSIGECKEFKPKER